MARPVIEIDSVDVEKLAALHCTNKEIASFFECSTDTIERRFAAELEKGRSQGKISLRRQQWQAAQKGNVTMLIWLGKQYLGQMDKIKEDVTLSASADERIKDLASWLLKLTNDDDANRET